VSTLPSSASRGTERDPRATPPPQASEEPQEQYTIRRRVFQFFGAGFYIYGREGELVGYCKQKAFRLKEDLRIYTDESCETELLRVRTPTVFDFSATYSVELPGGGVLGSWRRSGVQSFFRDQWVAFDPDGQTIGSLREDSARKAMLRRINGLIATMMPQEFSLTREDGGLVAVYRTHFNPFVYRLGVRIVEPDENFDDLFILAGGCLLGAVEGRQSNE